MSGSSGQRVVVVGGGWAGLAAATVLAQEGREVTLVEKSSRLGGRCFSIYHQEIGRWVDNGVHLFLPAYRDTLRVMECWGVREVIHFSHSPIWWLEEGGRKHPFKMGTGLWGGLKGIITFGGAPLSQRLKTARALRALMRFEGDAQPRNGRVIRDGARLCEGVIPSHDGKRSGDWEGLTVGQFLDRCGIDRDDCAGFWDALTLAVMNTSLSDASVAPLARAIKEGLLQNSSTSSWGMTQQPFRQWLERAARQYLFSMGCEIRLNCPAVELIVQNRRVKGVRTVEGEIMADGVILAIPPQSITALNLKGDLSGPGSLLFPHPLSFSYSTIIGIYWLFDRPVMPVEIGYIPRGFLHWAFGWVKKDGEEGFRGVAGVISGANDREEMRSREIHQRGLACLKERLLEAHSAQVEWMKVIRNRKATVALTPTAVRERPKVTTRIKGLFLAGDWVDTGLPATIESAVRSGIKAAQMVNMNIKPEEARSVHTGKD